MPAAARVGDPTGHGKPLGSGPGSPDVNIGSQKAWRAIPAAVGPGVEKASGAMKSLMGNPALRPPDAVSLLADMASGLAEAAAAAASAGAPGAPAAAASQMATLAAANVSLTSAYTAASSSGPEPAAAEAYAKGLQSAAAAAAGAAMAAIGALADIHTCPTVSGPAPHGPGVVTRGSQSVFINRKPAARQSDKVFEAAGGADPISQGCASVRIGG